MTPKEVPLIPWPPHPLLQRSILFPRQVSRGQIMAFQSKRLRRLVRHAWQNVPYYRRLFDAHGIRPGDIGTVADLPAIPVTAKNDLRELPVGETLARGLDPARLVADSTSGATGEPFATRRTAAERRATFPFWFRALRSAGLRLTDRQAAVRYVPDGLGRPLTPYRKALGHLGIWRCLPVHCGWPDDRIIRALREYRPDFVTGYAGALNHVAQAMLETGQRGIRPRLVMPGAEMMTDAMRRNIARAFGSSVYELYGCHEFSLVAWECREAGGYHVCDDGLILEVIKDGRAAAPGETGEVVGTNLHSFAMPFIRYRLNDMVTRGPDACPCGLPFSTILGIRGRATDYLRLPGGRRLHHLQVIGPLFDTGDWIRRFQFVQEREDRVVLQLVTFGEPGPARLRRVEEMARGALGPDVTFELRVVPRIDLGPGGKYICVRSLVGPGPAAWQEPGTPTAEEPA
jgi:phenylacetate-CoA ligase